MATLTQDTKTTLGVTAAVVVSFLTGALWINSRLGDFERAQTAGLLENTKRFDSIEYRLKSLEGTSDDRWRRSDMRAWVREFRAEHPDFLIPAVD